MKSTPFQRLLLAIFTLCLIFVSSSFAQDSDKLKKAKRPIPNSYIVVLDDSVDPLSDLLPAAVRKRNIKRVADDLAARHGGRVDEVYETAIKGFSVKLPPGRAEALSRDPRVKYVEEDFQIFAEETQAGAPWGLDRIDQRRGRNTTYEYDTSGLGVHAYVIDSGIRSTHTQFGGRVLFGADFVNAADNGADCDGHGTHVAGILGGSTYGVAKNVTIHNVRVLNCEGKGEGSGLFSAINWVTANHIGPAVANISIGLDGTSTTLENAIANSIKSGVHYALAAGNETVDACNHSPGGRVPTAFTVASIRDTDEKSSFSNFGPCVDIFAPGSSIVSAWFTSDTALASASGTSMASPFVAGAIARFLQSFPFATPAEVKASLLNSSSQEVVRSGGVGSPNKLLYSNIALNALPPIAIPMDSVAKPYPAETVVQGAPDVLSSAAGAIQVDINGFTTVRSDSVSFVLVGPTGAALLLQGNAGYDSSPTDVSYTISDTGSAYMSESALVNGSIYKPSKVLSAPVFPAPGPGSSYNDPGRTCCSGATLASTFGGSNPNGVWKLYAVHQGTNLTGIGGSIEGWQVRITNPSPTPTPSGRTNFALAANGGVAAASSQYSPGFPIEAVNDGDRRGLNWGAGGGWNDNTAAGYPDWAEIAFGGAKTIDRVDVFTIQDNFNGPTEPTMSTAFSQYGITAFDVQYWTGNAWATVPGGAVAGNNSVWRQFTFAPVQTSKVRVLITGSLSGFSRLVEIEAWGDSSTIGTPTPTPAPSPTPTDRANHALASNGGTTAVSSQYSSAFPGGALNNGDRKGNNWGAGGGWNDADAGAYPDWAEIGFSGLKSIDEIDVFTIQDNFAAPAEPTADMTFGTYGIVNFDVQYWTGSVWQTLPGGQVTGNAKVWRQFTFAPVETTKVRVLVHGALAGHSRLVEIEAWGGGAASPNPTPTPTPSPGNHTNVALASNGAAASASSTYNSGYAAAGTIDGDRRGLNWGAGGGWNDATSGMHPDSLQVDFSGTRTIDEVDVFTVQDNFASPQEPTEGATFSLYGITAFDVQYWNGSTWITIPGGSLTNNSKIWTKLTFSPVQTSKIRVVVNSSFAGYSRIVELEAWGT
jgi:subtilisin family serine protease